MATSSEAFAKLATWREYKILLRVTVIENGTTIAILVGQVAGIDLDAELLSVAVAKRHEFANFDLSGAAFSLEFSRLIITRNQDDYLVFAEETLSS